MTQPGRVFAGHPEWAARVEVHESGCWLWAGGKNTGYGVVWLKSEKKVALLHRWVLEQEVGYLGPKEFACHTCDVRHCVNPKHLYKGNAQTNRQDCMDRGRGNLAQSKRTHCPRGHPYDEQNTCFSNNSRRCRTCARNAMRVKALARKRQNYLTQETSDDSAGA